jgi:hypothetical protein
MRTPYASIEQSLSRVYSRLRGIQEWTLTFIAAENRSPLFLHQQTSDFFKIIRVTDGGLTFFELFIKVKEIDSIFK